MKKLYILPERERTVVEEFVSRVQSLLCNRLSTILLYGSKARGEGDEESDIDILIVAEGLRREDEKELDDIAGDILVNSAILISLIIFDSTDLEWKMGKDSPFVKNVLEDGIKIG